MNFILGYRDFIKKEEIVKKFLNSGLCWKNETIFSTDGFLLSNTLKQNTWLFVSNFRLFCIIDDKSKNEIFIKWDIKKNEVINRDGSLNVQIEVDGIYGIQYNRIWFGKDRLGVFYSRGLFPNKNTLLSTIKDLINKNIEDSFNLIRHDMP